MKENNNCAVRGNIKKIRGQFYTTSNPFHTDIFYKWMNLIPAELRKTILEPFAGANNIVKMIKDLGFKNEWACYDISPAKSVCESVDIKRRDTLKNFPSGFAAIITNPPYLAKNSAARNGMPYPDMRHDDIYKLALEIMLDNSRYVAAIIPESFATSGLFHARLYALASLTRKMFEDTDCPVCLAMFTPESGKAKANLQNNDFYIYSDNKFLGTYLQLKFTLRNAQTGIRWVFNSPGASIGIRCVDDTRSSSIKFIMGTLIPDSKIKVSSRSITKVKGLPEKVDLEEFLPVCNKVLAKYRLNTHDVFLTSFKGLRRDGKYRRRLDFNTARLIMNTALQEIRGGANDISDMAKLDASNPGKMGKFFKSEARQ